MINRDEVLELLEEALERLPEELRAGPLAAEGARGVPRQGAARGRRHPRRGPGAGRAHGAAHRGRARGRSTRRTSTVEDGRGRGPPPAARGRGLLRPEAGQLRDRARAHDEDGAGRPREAAGDARCRAPRGRASTTRADADEHAAFFDQDRRADRPRPSRTALVATSRRSCGVAGSRDPARAERRRGRRRGPRASVGSARARRATPVDVDARRSSPLERRRRRRTGTVVGRRGRGSAAAACDRSTGQRRRRASASSSSRARARARPTRSTATRSTSSRWSRDAVLLELPAGPALRGGLRRACAPTCGADRNEGDLRPCDPTTAIPAGPPSTSSRDQLTPSASEETPMAVPKKKTSKAKSRSRRASAWTLERAAAQRLPALRRGQAAPRRVRQLRLVPRPPGHRRRLSSAP